MRAWIMVAAIVTSLLVAACGGNEGEPEAIASASSEIASPSESPVEESSPFPDGSYRSHPYSEADIRAVVPDKFEDALLANELEGANAITWTFEIADGAFTWSYAVGGDTGVDTGEAGMYTATEDSITFIDSTGWRTTARWEVSGDQLRLRLGQDVEHEFIHDVPWKWYAAYFMSEPFTKVA